MTESVEGLRESESQVEVGKEPFNSFRSNNENETEIPKDSCRLLPVIPSSVFERRMLLLFYLSVAHYLQPEEEKEQQAAAAGSNPDNMY
jgi:hypothetical protein